MARLHLARVVEVLLVGLVAAAIGATPGLLAWHRQRKRDKREENRERVADEVRHDETAVEGFARLVSEMRTELDREKQDCDRRIKRIERDCAREIERVKKELLEEVVRLETKVNEGVA